MLDLAYRPGDLRLADGRPFAVMVGLVHPTSAETRIDARHPSTSTVGATARFATSAGQ